MYHTLFDYFHLLTKKKTVYDEEGIRSIIRVPYTSLMGFKKQDIPYISKRVRHAVGFFSIVRKILRPKDKTFSVRYLLPHSASCTRGEVRLRMRLGYLFQHSLREKVYNTLESAHHPLFIKKSELMRDTMMTGMPPPISVDPTKFG